jgi:DNA ligase (NAD+)
MEKQQLEQKVLEAKKNYYSGYPTITDAQYDALESTLKQEYPDSIVLSIVGYEIDKKGKVKHNKKMLSLEKIKNFNDLRKFANLTQGDIFCSYKMDGSACSIVFENGKFFQAKTRGNGTWGEIITKHLEHLNFPKELNCEKLEVRGEVVISQTNFEKLKKELNDDEIIQRNIVSGLLHRKEGLEICKYLDFFAYDVLGKEFKTEEEKFNYLKSIGFKTPNKCLLGKDFEESDFMVIENDYKFYFNYLVDGLVFSINNCNEQEELGYTSHHPKGKIAYKFQSETAVTKIKDIEVGLGRTGKLSFVGIIEPVELSGVQINRVTLHNVAYIKEHQINIGALIEITRSNEVIPKHISTLESEGEFEFIENCPCCGSQLQQSETEVDLVCINDLCEAKKIARIMGWININEIYYLGAQNLFKMIDTGFVNQIADLYKITKEQLLKLDGFQIGLATKIIDSINTTKEVDSYKFLAGLGINNVGRRMSKLLLEKYGTVKNLIANLNNNFADDIKGIGPKIKEKLINFLTNEKMVKEIENIFEQVTEKELKKSEGNLSGKNLAITGTLTKGRKEIEKDIETAGGKVGSISNNTNYLVANEISNSSKFTKANKLGIKIITEKELYEIIEKE